MLSIAYTVYTFRSQTYKYFDQELQDIIEGDAAPRYPLICSEVTQRFSQISKYINDIKVCIGYRHPIIAMYLGN